MLDAIEKTRKQMDAILSTGVLDVCGVQVPITRELHSTIGLIVEEFFRRNLELGERSSFAADVEYNGRLIEIKTVAKHSKIECRSEMRRLHEYIVFEYYRGRVSRIFHFTPTSDLWNCGRLGMSKMGEPIWPRLR